MSILSIFKKKDDTPKPETTKPEATKPTAQKSSSSGSSNPFAAIIARETGGTPKTASSDKFKSPLSGSSSSSSPQFKAYSAPSKTGSITVKDKRTGKTVSYESTLTDKDRKELEASNPFKSMFRDTGTPSLSERSKENDRLKGIDWSTASDEQKAYNEVYYKTLDDPTHTKMYTDLEAATLGREDATKAYKENRAALDEELKTLGKDRGKDSYEYKALKAFIDSYETLGRRMASGYSKSEAARVSRSLDENIQGIYGGLMAQPDFQEKAAAGLAEAKRHPVEFADLRQALEHATPIQRDLVYYLRATEGKEGVDRFLASGLGQMMTYANASQVYAKQLENDSEFLRGAAMFGQQVAEGVTSLAQEGQRLYRGFTGKDVDDPNDRNLGGGYTISDSTDDYLRAALGKDLADAGITDDIFSSLAADGLAKIQGRTEKSSWAKEIMDNATPYQKQVLGFLYEASGKDAVKETWESLKQREQAVWAAVKQGSNGVPRDVSDYLSDLYIGYANLGGMDAPSWLNSDGSKTLEGMLLEGTRSASQQLVPLLASGGVANAVGAAGASRAAAAAAGRIAGASLMSTTIGGQSYGEALQHDGVSHGEALGYALTEAAMEFITEKLLGVTGGSLTAGAKEKLAVRIASPVVRALGAVGISSLGEGTQEYLQEALEPIIASVFLHEGDLRDAAGEFIDPKNLLDPDRLYAGALGVLTSLGMSPGTVAIDTSNNRYYSELGKAMGSVDALTKTADIILNADAAGLDAEALSDAKKTAQLIKNGGKVSDLAAGKMIVDFGKAGGDLSHLAHLETQAYTKDTLTQEDLLAGATSMLVDLDGDVGLADAVVKAATNQPISQEQLNAIQNDPAAVQVLSQLLAPLDMSQDTALSRAARNTTRKSSTGNKVYDTLKAENPTKTVATPISQRLYDAGMEWSEAEQISGVIEKVMTGVAITEDEAELINTSNAAVQSMLRDVVGVELDENATIGRIMTVLNDAAANMAKVKDLQAGVREGAEQAAKARMPIPPNQSRATIRIGDREYSHDEFIRDYMEMNKVSQAVAEQAWQQRATVDAALNGGEESNGTRTIPGNPEGRDTGLAAGGPVRGVQERDTGSGQPADTRGAEGPGREDSVRSEGNPTPVRGAKVQEVITKLNTKQRDFVNECKDDGFTSVTLVKGPLIFVTPEGKQVPVNALVNSNGDLVIRWDNPKLRPSMVANHERIHLWLGQLTNAERTKYVSDALYEIFGEDSQDLATLYELYAKKYAKSYSNLSPEAFKAAVFEEILADMYSGINMDKAPGLQQQAEMYVENTNLRGQFFGEESTGETNYGESFERFNLADPFRESTDWDIPSDVRPFPGEEPMHEQLPRLSVSGMAEGGNFDLVFNDAGQPYALVNKDTGERVTEVTADMMIGTPLGDVVQMAVDNGSISEDEAKVQRQMLADAMNLIVKYNDAAVVWEIAGSQLFSAIKSNSDKQYNKTIDFSTICKKTMAIVDAMSETMKRLGRGLTRREVEAVYLETGKAGEATPCPVCYVFSRWMGIGNLLDQMSKFQDKYAGKSEAELVQFMTEIEDQARAYAAAASKSKQEDFYDKNGNLKIGKVISDMKSKPNSKAASAIKKLNQHQQANEAIAELTKNMPNATPEQAGRWRSLIKTLKRNVLKDSQIAALQEQMEQADAEVEVFEVYQWLAKTVLMSDASQVNEDGEAIGSWKKNPDFKPVPKDILFDLNRGGDFAKDYPLSWAFRTGKGCAMGKAITPYADARVGETIQGVAMDVKNIRVGIDINEFLNGDVKKQQKTLESARKKQKQQNLIGGMRYQSTSDFRYEFGSDYLMTFFEMQALGANVQLYTKVIESVDFLASTGADCNLSVMPLGDGYVVDPKTGKKKLAFSNVTGINAEAAIKKAKQYDNVQLILVGINDENIRLALEGTDVTFVIPFHGSGQSVHQVQTLMDLLGEHLDVTQAQDYTSVQSDHVSPKQTAEQKAMWDLRVDIITGKCADGLTAEQQALLAKNPHLQKLYNMFYMDETAPAYQNFLGKDQAEQIFPYEYWNREGDYEHADENGRTFQEYCKSMGIIPRFSGINSKGERVGFGDFTKDKGYWKLLIDRSMYENVYDENGEWIGYGKYRDQQQINMSNVKLSDLDPETGKAQFTNGEMSKQYDATHSEADRQNLDTIVTNSIQRIEAMRDKGDVFDKTQVNKGFRTNIMKANAEIRGMDDDGSVVRASVAGDESAEETVVYIKDGYNRDTGKIVDFINAILDGRKKGETRTHNSFPYKNWVGLAKGKADGKVYGRVKFGKPYLITNQSPEYQDALIAGTDYDLADGESKWYYPVLEIEDFRDNPKPFRPIAQTGKYRRDASNEQARGMDDVRASAADDTDLTEAQQEIVDFNNNQTEVGSELRHLSGPKNKQKRYQDNVGKEVSGKIFVHKLYADEVIKDPQLLSNAKAALKEEYPDFEYNCITYDPKTGSIRFDEAPDFDTADEPTPGWQITVMPDGDVKKPHYESQIWHHKWQWVKNDYQERNPNGFDVEESWDRSRQYLNRLRSVPMETYRFSNSKNGKNGSFAQRGIPDARVWGEQLRYFGLDDMIHDRQWKEQESPDVRPSVALDSPIFDSDQRQEPETDSYGSVFYIKPTDSSWEILRDDDDNLMNTQYMKDAPHNFNIFDNPMDPMPPRGKQERVFSKSKMRGHKTQKTGETVSTYNKIGDKLEEVFGKERAHNLRILDASSGTGFGTQALLDRGFKVTDLEPFPPRIEPKSGPTVEPYVPNYRNYGDLIYALETGQEEPFDIVISNAVINVMAQDARAEVIAALGKFAKPDGHIFINTFSKTQPSKNAPNIVIQPDTDKLGREVYTVSTETIQKGFTTPELKGFIRDVLNQTGTEGFDFSTVKPPKGEKSLGGMTTWVDMNGETIEEQGRNQQPDVRASAADENNDQDTNPYKEGSFEYTAFEMIKKAQDPKALQDWVNELRQKQADAKEAGKLKAPVIPSADKATPVNKTQQKIRENQLAKLLEKYGAFKQGEKAARDIPIPEKISDDRRVRRYVRTVAEAEATPQRLAERIGGETLVNELLSYTPITDSDAIAHAGHELNRLGYKKALKEWQGKSSTDHFPTKYDIAFGSKLLVEAMRNGDDAIAMQTLADLAAMETQAGQVAQAARLLKQLGPSGQLYYVQKAVDRLNHQNEGRIAKGTMAPIIIDEDLAKAVILAETQEEMDDAMEALKQDIADKLPVTLKDRWDAWRYLAMLGNPRTHVRNYLGNLVFSPVRFTKDLLAAAGEKMFIQDASERTKDARALMKDSQYNEIRQFAEKDFEVMQDDLTGNGKMNPLNEIMGMRKVLPGLLGKASEFNDKWLTKEDVIFLRKAYVSALTQFIAARGLSLEDLSSGSFESNKLMDEARRYAALEAQKATYRDFSRVAAALNSLRRTAPGLSPLLDGLMPFTKTPINILKRGLEYSPAGLAKALTVDLAKVKRGDLTAAEAIDHVAAGMTGTGIALVGWLLASLGMATGGADDDDKKDAMEKTQGHQNYSLEIDGKSYTIDWMAPAALPFFVGVEAYKQLTGEGQASFFDFLNAVTLIAEPMMSLSMLDGINSTLSAVRSGSNSPIQSVASNILASYVSQGAPTILGQVARTLDPDRRSTYVDKNSENPAFMQRFIQNLQGKVPGLASQKMAYVDLWGRKDTNESLILRGLENFISPGYASRINETPVDTELLRLAEATGSNKVLPGAVAKYFQVEGETLNLNAKQYEQYKTTTGKTAFKLLGDLFADPVYAAMDDAQKAAAVEQAMKIATTIGKQDVAPTYKADGWIQRAIDQDNLETASMFHMLESADTGLSNYQLISAMDWLTDEDKGKLIMSEHPNTYRQMTDYTRKGYKFTLTDEQIAREREIYEGYFWEAYNELVSSSKFRKASVAKQAEMIKDMQSDLGTRARKKLGKELRSAGIKSHKPSDADVPDDVANLYDLLNRP